MSIEAGLKMLAEVDRILAADDHDEPRKAKEVRTRRRVHRLKLAAAAACVAAAVIGTLVILERARAADLRLLATVRYVVDYADLDGTRITCYARDVRFCDNLLMLVDKDGEEHTLYGVKFHLKRYRR